MSCECRDYPCLVFDLQSGRLADTLLSRKFSLSCLMVLKLPNAVIFYAVPHVVMTPNNTFILLLLHTCNFANAVNHNVTIWYAGHPICGGCNWQTENHCSSWLWIKYGWMLEFVEYFSAKSNMIIFTLLTKWIPLSEFWMLKDTKKHQHLK